MLYLEHREQEIKMYTVQYMHQQVALGKYVYPGQKEWQFCEGQNGKYFQHTYRFRRGAGDGVIEQDAYCAECGKQQIGYFFRKGFDPCKH
jgi:hypothetical protein